MPAKEIKELRQAGKLDEAYNMATAELEADSSNIWGKRNLSWVLYAQLDVLVSNLDAFIEKIQEVKELALPETEEMFFDNISLVIAKAARAINKEATLDLDKIHQLFDIIKELPLKRNSKWFSVLFSSFQKGMKESNRYIEFADWWDFHNFRPEDFQKEKMPNGKEVMSIAEQAYIAYAKQLLPKQNQQGEIIFDKDKVKTFLPKLSHIIDNYPQFQYPAYFNAKLLLALGERDNILDSLLPFAKKKRSEFWVWEILADAFNYDDEIVFACYCMALSCKSPEEMLVGIRQKMAREFIKREFYNNAKTEIEILCQTRIRNGFRIPEEVRIWRDSEWFNRSINLDTNDTFYKQFTIKAETLLFSDIEEEIVLVEFVNNQKKILNFIQSEEKYGFFKYDRFLEDVKIGDLLKVRFASVKIGGLCKLNTAYKFDDPEWQYKFIKEVSGIVNISSGKSFGFLKDIYINPNLVKKRSLINGMKISGHAIKSFNYDKNSWTWKLI
jgi:hypothetical protein